MASLNNFTNHNNPNNTSTNSNTKYDTSLAGGKDLTLEDKKHLALKKYEATIKKNGGERLLSGSEDFTLMIWDCKTMKQI